MSTISDLVYILILSSTALIILCRTVKTDKGITFRFIFWYGTNQTAIFPCNIATTNKNRDGSLSRTQRL